MKSAITYFSVLFVSIGVVAWARMGGAPQIGMRLPFVQLQTTTPGFAETGNTNITGVAIAGQVLANGVGAPYGVTGQSDSPTGAGLIGHATATTDANAGVYALTDSLAGTSITATNMARTKTVQLNGPNGAVWTDGHYYRQYAVGERHAVDPIAYGNISSNGTILGGSGNFTMAHIGTGAYDLTIDGESYNPANCTVVVTLTSLASAYTGIIDGGSAERVIIHSGTNYVDSSFNFVVYKPNPSN